jgi:hypothetical protein
MPPFRQKGVQRFSLGDPLLELRGLGLELLIGEGLILKFQGIDFFHNRPEALELALVLGAENFFNKPFDHKKGEQGSRTS